MEENMKEFVAFSRKLLRSLELIREALLADDIETVKKMLNDLIEDTRKDLEA